MSLSYLRDDCHKQTITHIRESWWFESMYTLQGKTSITQHVRFPLQSTYARRTLSTGSPHTWQPFTGSYEVETCPYTQKKSWQPKIDWPSRHLGWPHSSSHAIALEWGREVSAQWLHSYFSLLGPYHQYAIGTFNTCSWGPTHRSLTDTGGGYNLGGAGLPHTTFWPSQPAVCIFHLSAPLGLQFDQVYQLNQSVEFENLWPPHGLPTTRPSTVVYIYA
jgi:hypothetical protein